MLFASKTRWAGSAFLLLTAGMLVPGFLQSAAGPDSTTEEVAEVHQEREQEAAGNSVQQRTLPKPSGYRFRLGVLAPDNLNRCV